MERLRDTWKVELLGADTERPNEELVPVAWALGLDFNRGEWLSLLVNRTPVRLSLEFSSGRSRALCAVHVTAELEHAGDAGDRPQLVVRRERGEHRTNKETGLSREVQTGVAAFDDALYLDSDASDDEVQRVLSREATREALSRLITDELATEVTFTPRSVSARVLPQTAQRDAEALLTVIEAMVIAARGGGPRGRVHARSGARLERVFQTAVPLTMVAAVLAHLRWSTTLAFPALWGVGVGVPLGVVAWFAARPWVRGDSDSGRRLSSIASLVGGAVTFLVAGVLITSNALLGSGEVRSTSGEVRSVTSKPKGRWTAVVRWEDGPVEEVDLRFNPEVGGRVTRSVHDGYFEPWGVGYRAD